MAAQGLSGGLKLGRRVQTAWIGAGPSYDCPNDDLSGMDEGFVDQPDGHDVDLDDRAGPVDVATRKTSWLLRAFLHRTGARASGSVIRTRLVRLSETTFPRNTQAKPVDRMLDHKPIVDAS